MTFYSSLNLFWLLNPAVSVLKGKKGPRTGVETDQNRSQRLSKHSDLLVFQRSFRRLPSKDYLQNISSLTRFIKDKNHAKSAQKK